MNCEIFTYRAYYKNNVLTIEATTSYNAQKKAQAIWNLKEKQRLNITIVRSDADVTKATN